MIGYSLALALPLVCGMAQDDLPSTWKAIAPKEAGFSVAMPPSPTQKKQKVKTATGTLEVTLWIAEGRNDSLFLVSYSDYPAAELKKGSLEKRLDYARDGAVSSAGGKLQSERIAYLIDGDERHRGRDLIIEKDGAIVARMRMFLIGRRLYQVTVLGTATTKEAGIFMDSFRLSR